jgi:hypothetical protein
MNVIICTFNDTLILKNTGGFKIGFDRLRVHPNNDAGRCCWRSGARYSCSQGKVRARL